MQYGLFKPEFRPLEDHVRQQACLLALGDITRQTIYVWRKTRGFPKPTTFSGRNFYSKTKVVEWMNQNGFEDNVHTL